MSHNIYATFDSRDSAERAAARLRGKGLAFSFAISGAPVEGHSSIRAAPAALSLLFPYRQSNFAANSTNTSNSQFLGKAVLTADTLGIPVYPGGGETRVRITVDDESLAEASALLHNCGAYDIR